MEKGREEAPHGSHARNLGHAEVEQLNRTSTLCDSKPSRSGETARKPSLAPRKNVIHLRLDSLHATSINDSFSQFLIGFVFGGRSH